MRGFSNNVVACLEVVVKEQRWLFMNKQREVLLRHWFMSAELLQLWYSLEAVYSVTGTHGTNYQQALSDHTQNNVDNPFS